MKIKRYMIFINLIRICGNKDTGACDGCFDLSRLKDKNINLNHFHIIYSVNHFKMGHTIRINNFYVHVYQRVGR